jgi:uncharacterized protein YjiS (DUF1127 family)
MTMNTLSIARTPARAASPGARPIRAALAGLKAQLATWSARQRQRAAVLALSDAALKDLGISRAQAAFDYNRPFWRG